MIEVGNVYEITQDWLNSIANVEIQERMPEFKNGAKFKVLAVEEISMSRPDAVVIENVETGDRHNIEDCPISDLVWSFFSSAEERQGLIKLVN